MRTLREIWDDYKRLLKGREYAQWGELWTDDGAFVVAYGKGRASFQEESYAKRENIVHFFSAADKKIADMDFSGCAIYEEKGDPIHMKGEDERTFFCIFNLRIVTTDNYNYYNHIACLIKLRGDKIAEIVEYGDPNTRGAFFEIFRAIPS